MQYNFKTDLLIYKRLTWQLDRDLCIQIYCIKTEISATENKNYVCFNIT